MVYFSIKNKDLNYVVKTFEDLKIVYRRLNIWFSGSEIERASDGEWYISIVREGNINAFNI